MVKLHEGVLRSESKKNCAKNECNSSLEISRREINFPGLVPEIEDADEDDGLPLEYVERTHSNYKYFLLYFLITIAVSAICINYELQNYMKIPYQYMENSFSNLVYSKNDVEPYQTYLQSHSPEIYEEILKELRHVQEAATYLQKKQKFMEKKTSALQYQLKKMSKKPQNHALINEAKTRSLIKEALDMYDADKLGLRDYALESGGGSIVSTPSTKPFVYSTHYVIFGILSYQKTSNPRLLIQPNMHPGQCFAFEGTSGKIRLKLSNLIYISAITLEHAAISLLTDEDIESAPQEFEITGLEDQKAETGMNLGFFRYSIDGPSIQTFLLSYPGNSVPFENVELWIKSNYGNEKYTCVYRIRVHGRRA